MKKHVNLRGSASTMLTVVACLGLGGALGAPLQASAAPQVAATQQAAGTVSGVVVDGEGEPLIGATVMVKGTKTGVATDIDGRFTVAAPAGSVLQISSIGYKPQELVVKAGQAAYAVTMAEDSQVLGEVVAIGYGTQKKGDVTSAVSRVSADDFTMGNANNAGDLIKGKVAGLTITKPSGDPGAGSSITLRGIVSMNGNSSPLVLIDGVPGDLGTVPPENIAEINVLKDASAAAIYGTRGASGVILITTKTGKREQQVEVNVNAYVSFSKWSKKADFMGPEDIRRGVGAFNDEGYDTNWLDAISRTAVTQNYTASITGGAKNTSYYGNFTYRKAEGVMKKTGNEDFSMSFDVSHWMFNDWLKLNLNLVADNYKYDINDATAIYRQAVIRNPTAPIWNEDGSYATGDRLQYYNPVGMQNEQTGEARTTTTRMTGNITFEPIKGWQTNLMLAIHRTMNRQGSYKSKSEPIGVLNGTNGSAGASSYEDRDNYLELTSKYNHTWGKNRFDALVGYSWSRNTYEDSYANNSDFPTDYFLWNNLGAGSRLEQGKAGMGSSKNESTLIGWFGRVSYGFDNRYNILASIRYEGSSKFGADHKWGAFPSVSLGWNINNEQWFKDEDWMNLLKLRAGFGQTGVIPGYPYQSLVRYAYEGGNYFRGGSWHKGLAAQSNPNPDLRWEKATEFNVGIDFGFFNDRFGGSIDVYSKRTTDMLFDYAVPSPPNLFTSTTANVGKMRNNGIEILLRGTPVQLKDFQWQTTFTLQHNANKLISLSNRLYQTENVLWQVGIGDPITQWTHKIEVGKPLGEIWSLKAVGVSEATGLWLIQNAENGKCAEFFQDMRADEQWYQRIGNGIPKVTIGWGNQFFYKDFDLSFQCQGQFGFKIVNQQRAFFENNNTMYNRLRSASDKIGGNRALSAQQAAVVTSYYIEDGDYFKMSNLTLGYTYKFKNTKWMKSVRGYFSIDNVFTITKYKGIDPELSVDNIWTPGVDDRDKYPTIRSFTLGVNLTF